ncbi:hypothetical protein [Alienimonas chondri]|uniref:Hexosyltransferase n=1 Tax=Alienimonas chondri TaxID=2681879 RepID=A0ABX1VDM7_9PLAN|nr:hypothetical protein [Alienimonas chondri]NNJ26202.1 hypothetical protein [Alienimonas chondri]
MPPRLLHCLYTCRRDRGLLERFLLNHQPSNRPADRRVAVYDAAGPDDGDGLHGLETWSVDAPAGYEFLAIKTYAMLQRALAEPDWDYLLKTDVDCRVDAEQVTAAMRRQVRYAGEVLGRGDATSKQWHFRKCRHRIYEEPCPPALFPSTDAGFAAGHAYLLHRDAAAAVVARGVYFAMRHIYEDVMVGQALEGVFPVQPYRLAAHGVPSSPVA